MTWKTFFQIAAVAFLSNILCETASAQYRTVCGEDFLGRTVCETEPTENSRRDYAGAFFNGYQRGQAIRAARQQEAVMMQQQILLQEQARLLEAQRKQIESRNNPRTHQFTDEELEALLSGAYDN